MHQREYLLKVSPLKKGNITGIAGKIYIISLSTNLKGDV